VLAENVQTTGGLECLSRIEHAYNGLAATARRVADLVLQQPTAAVGLSITDLAQRSGVSDTTVLRFARALGYQGYRQFALALAASVAETGEDRALDVHIGDEDDFTTMVQKVFVAEAQALAKAWQSIDPEALRRAVEALARARRVQCYAVGGSGLLAIEAVYRLTRLGLDCVAIYDPVHMAMQASHLTKEDVVIGFSQTGRTHSTVAGMAAAHGAGATTICVTSRPHSPITRQSDIALVVLELQAAFRGAHLDSKIAELTLIDAVATCLARQLPPRPSGFVDRLESTIERACFDGGDLPGYRRQGRSL
jgi:DNA-binding MurR/RpiR family transcriptional regulator